MLMSQPRIFFAMSRDQLLPAGVSKVHPTFRTPYITTIITCVIVAIVAGVHADQRARRDDQHRHAVRVRGRVDGGHHPARQAAGRAAAVQGAVRVRSSRCSACCSCVYLMLSLSVMTWVRFLVWLDIGMIIYWFYGRTHSPLVEPGGSGGAAAASENLANFLKMLGYMLLFNGFCITLLGVPDRVGRHQRGPSRSGASSTRVLQLRRHAHQAGDCRRVRPEDRPDRRRGDGRRVRAGTIVEQALGVVTVMSRASALDTARRLWRRPHGERAHPRRPGGRGRRSARRCCPTCTRSPRARAGRRASASCWSARIPASEIYVRNKVRGGHRVRAVGRPAAAAGDRDARRPAGAGRRG